MDPARKLRKKHLSLHLFYVLLLVSETSVQQLFHQRSYDCSTASSLQAILQQLVDSPTMRCEALQSMWELDFQLPSQCTARPFI